MPQRALFKLKNNQIINYKVRLKNEKLDAAKELKEFLEDCASEDMTAYENAEFRITKVGV